MRQCKHCHGGGAILSPAPWQKLISPQPSKGFEHTDTWRTSPFDYLTNEKGMNRKYCIFIPLEYFIALFLPFLPQNVVNQSFLVEHKF